jgi:hypothetical protein
LFSRLLDTRCNIVRIIKSAEEAYPTVVGKSQISQVVHQFQLQLRCSKLLTIGLNTTYMLIAAEYAVAKHPVHHMYYLPSPAVTLQRLARSNYRMLLYVRLIYLLTTVCRLPSKVATLSSNKFGTSIRWTAQEGHFASSIDSAVIIEVYRELGVQFMVKNNFGIHAINCDGPISNIPNNSQTE